ncbi:MAG TPA: DUF3501 family protein [Haliangiales bacterium]|nr:DUF3501 family protein [Haliangiales bacterium]
MPKIGRIERRDVLGPTLYTKVRDDFRKRIIEIKRARRVHVGDRVTLVFENRDTLRFQIEEMLRAEHIAGDEGIQAELDVYNELMPDEGSLSATLFLEIPRDEDAKVALPRFVGLDEHVTLEIGAHRVRAAFEPGRQEEERISAVQYLRFPLTADAMTELRAPGTPLAIAIDHPDYRHRAELDDAVRESLARDYE